LKTFKTIAGVSEGLYKEKGSKFLAYAFPVNSEEEIKTALDELRTLHHKARHICYAYRLGADKTVFKYSDANEPPNTAGPPIFGQIKSMELTNVLVAVVRYFGGTKLGTGGLIQAMIIEDFERADILVEIPYPGLSELMNFIKQNNVGVKQQDFGEVCRLRITVPAEEAIGIKKKLLDMKNLILSE
jgi:putative IMPACT (imprinted ancient) family translation regulator